MLSYKTYRHTEHKNLNCYKTLFAAFSLISPFSRSLPTESAIVHMPYFLPVAITVLKKKPPFLRMTFCAALLETSISQAAAHPPSFVGINS
jgi:hypothetical protein